MHRTSLSLTLLRLTLMNLALLTPLAVNALQPASTGGDLLIENVTVISPEVAAPQPGRWVRIHDGRIVDIASKPITVSAGTERLNGAGKYLTPGLMDSHVHLSVPAGLPFGVESPELTQLKADYDRQQPRSYLYFGVTQVLDLAGFGDAGQRFDAQPQRPDRFYCGAASVLNGYPRMVVDGHVHSILSEFIIEPENADAIPAGVDPTEHTPEAVVARIAASGARCVKVFIEDGFGAANHIPLLKSRTLQRVRTAAHDAGLTFIAHANAIDMQRIAVAANVDVIAHGLWNWGNNADSARVSDDVAALLQQVHKQHIGFQPTMRVIGGLRDLFLPDTLNDPMLRKVTPASVLAFYRTDAAQFFKNEMRADFDGAPDNRIAARFQQVNEQGARVVQQLHALAHPLLLASDTPQGPVYTNQPGYNSYQELRALAAAGVPLDAVLRAGTINNAKQFGVDRDYGSVEKGKIANLLLLPTNPLQTAEAWSQIDTVILRGKPIARELLAADNNAVSAAH